MKSSKLIPVTLPLVALLVNCSQDDASISSKEAVVGTPVFPSKPTPPATNPGQTKAPDAGGGSASPPPAPPSSSSSGGSTPQRPAVLEQPIDTICSDDITRMLGGNVMSAPSLSAAFTNDDGRVVCEIHDGSIRDTLINERVIRLEDVKTACPTLADGTYRLTLTTPSGASLLASEHMEGSGQQLSNFFVAAAHFSSADVANGYLNLWRLGEQVSGKTSGGASWVPSQQGTSTSPSLDGLDGPPQMYSVALATVRSGEVTFTAPAKGAVLMDKNPLGYNGLGSNAECSGMGSPLLVQINPGRIRPAAIRLTAPLSGIYFDLLGKNSYPTPHQKKQISWFDAAGARGNYFIVLPGADGAVHGINEMFGNNTLGPDGTFADNGYEALRKWDGRRDDGAYHEHLRDGVITPADPVFRRLRLWSDANGDGKAEPSEMIGLSDIEVVAIDLDYDPSFRETDRYGNQIKMKSVLKTSDGVNHLMYDLWFRIIR